MKDVHNTVEELEVMAAYKAVIGNSTENYQLDAGRICHLKMAIKSTLEVLSICGIAADKFYAALPVRLSYTDVYDKGVIARRLYERKHPVTVFLYERNIRVCTYKTYANILTWTLTRFKYEGDNYMKPAATRHYVERLLRK